MVTVYLRNCLKKYKETLDIRSRPINFDLPHVCIPSIKMVWQNSNLQHKSVHKRFPAIGFGNKNKMPSKEKQPSSLYN